MSPGDPQAPCDKSYVLPCRPPFIISIQQGQKNKPFPNTVSEKKKQVKHYKDSLRILVDTSIEPQQQKLPEWTNKNIV